MKRMSIDLETLGTRPGSVVLAIGYAIVCDDEGLVDSNVIYPSKAEQLSMNFRVHSDTLDWWMQQSEEARHNTFVPASMQCAVTHAMTLLGNAWAQHGCEEVWGNGPTMDVSLIEALANRTRLHAPWGFRDVRCLRTLRTLAPGVPRIESEVPHSAQHDAIAQGLWAKEMLEWLKN